MAYNIKLLVYTLYMFVGWLVVYFAIKIIIQL